MKKIICVIVSVIILITVSSLNTGCGSSPGTTPCNDSILMAPYNVGLVAYYKFFAGSPADFSGNGHNGTISGSVTPATNPNGITICAMNFGGTSNDYIKVLSNTAFDFDSSTAMSVVLWYRPTLLSAGSYELLFGRDSVLNCPDTYGQYSLGLYDCRKPVFGFYHTSCWDTTLVSSGSCTAINNSYIAQGWQNLIAIYNPISPNPWKIYRNGIISIDVHGPCGPSISLSGDIYIGRRFKGDIDDVKVYNRALTNTEIAFLKSYVSPCCK